MTARKALVVIATPVAASARFAQDRPFTPALACRAVADEVARRGAALLATGRDRVDRYVSDQSRCALGEQITPAWAPAADDANCFVGDICEQRHG